MRNKRGGLSAGRFPVVAALCACLVGCATSGAGFNPHTLREGGLIVGGTTSRQAALDGHERLDYAGRLERALRARYPSAEIVGAREVRKALGRSVYRQMLDSYRFHGTVGVVFTNGLQQHWPSTRYVIFARVEQDEVQQRHRALTGGSGYELESSRALTVSVQVFDLFERPRERVWAGALQDAGVERRRVFGHFTVDDLRPLYPEPPPTAVVLDNVLDRLAAYVGSDRK